MRVGDDPRVMVRVSQEIPALRKLTPIHAGVLDFPHGIIKDPGAPAWLKASPGWSKVIDHINGHLTGGHHNIITHIVSVWLGFHGGI